MKSGDKLQSFIRKQTGLPFEIFERRTATGAMAVGIKLGSRLRTVAPSKNKSDEQNALEFLRAVKEMCAQEPLKTESKTEDRPKTAL